MRSFLAGLRRLVIPWGATADQPRVVIATDDPLARTFAEAAISYYYSGGHGFATWVAPAGGGGGIWGLSAGPADPARFTDRVGFVTAEYGGDVSPVDDGLTIGCDQRSGKAAHVRFWHDIDGGGQLVGVTEVHGDRVDVFGPATITGDLTVTGTITSGGGGGVAYAESTTDITPVSNTSPAAGSAVCGVTFVAPASGKVFVTVGGNITQGQVGNETILGWHMKTADVLNAGTDVLTPVVERAIRVGRSVVSGGGVAVGAMSRRQLVTGLTPGATYNVVTKHWVTGGTGGTVEQREIIVEPTA